MLYIAFPEGMKHVVKTILIEGEETKKDMLTAESGEHPDIELQAIVKRALQHRSKSKASYEEAGVIIYYTRPPYDSAQYLKYEPQNNGKYPALCCKLVTGASEKPFNPADSTSHERRSRWSMFANLSREKQDEVEKKRVEQRLNRQHIGPSPNAT